MSARAGRLASCGPPPTAFGEDHVIPPKATHHNAERYKTGVIAHKEFEGRPQVPGAPGWEELADDSLDWAMNPNADV